MKVMLVDRDPERADVLESALEAAGHEVIGRVADEARLASEVLRCQPDIIIIDMASPGRDTLEQMRLIGRDQPKPIILFSDQRDPDYIRQAIRAGVSAYVVDGLSEDRVMPIIEVAVARFAEFQALRQELDDTRSQLADRKIVEKAKGLLMEKRRMSENEAYQFLRNAAMSRNARLADVARIVLSLESSST